MTFSAGQVVSGYEFLGSLGSSGFGVAYKVRNLALDRLESLKLLPSDLQRSPQGLDRFRREIRVHTRLDHPNIVRFYKAEELEGQLVITTELAEGVSLKQRLHEKRLSLKEAIGYLDAALSGLGYAHQRGIVHRCVEPANLIIGPDNHVKITGFSFAKTAIDPRLTLKGFVIGVADYIAPEQVTSDAALDGRADLYAVGAILYEVATGNPPFPSKSIFETMQAHVHKRPRPPSEINPALPPGLERVILTALEKKRSDRFATAEEFRNALEEVKTALKETAA